MQKRMGLSAWTLMVRASLSGQGYRLGGRADGEGRGFKTMGLGAEH